MSPGGWRYIDERSAPQSVSAPEILHSKPRKQKSNNKKKEKEPPHKGLSRGRREKLHIVSIALPVEQGVIIFPVRLFI
jgi:hypothetical protein